ncbi:MAG: electron transfer flavoprotein subunit beta/FixA family protein [Candidatus Njordarchaeia archaeon]
MKIGVAVKFTPNPYQVKMHARTGTLLIEDVEFGVNPKDYYAMEAALQLKEKHGGEVVAISIGPKEADEALREALGMGVDRGVLIYDKSMFFAEPTIMAEVFAEYTKKFENFDLIITGVESSDMKGGLFGARLAAMLGYSFAINAREIELQGDKLKVVQDFFPKKATVEIPLPAVITVSDRFSEPRYPNMWDISEAYQDDKVKHVALSELGFDEKARDKYVKIRRYGGYTEEEGVRRRLSGSKDEIVKSITELIFEYL